jgi:hypothetical protein
VASVLPVIRAEEIGRLATNRLNAVTGEAPGAICAPGAASIGPAQVGPGSPEDLDQAPGPFSSPGKGVTE